MKVALVISRIATRWPTSYPTESHTPQKISPHQTSHCQLNVLWTRLANVVPSQVVRKRIRTKTSDELDGIKWWFEPLSKALQDQQVFPFTHVKHGSKDWSFEEMCCGTSAVHWGIQARLPQFYCAPAMISQAHFAQGVGRFV